MSVGVDPAALAEPVIEGRAGVVVSTGPLNWPHAPRV